MKYIIKGKIKPYRETHDVKKMYKGIKDTNKKTQDKHKGNCDYFWKLMRILKNTISP